MALSLFLFCLLLSLFPSISTGLTETLQLSAEDGNARDMFGYSIAIAEGDLLFISAPGVNIYQGLVYAFNCSSLPCLQKAMITAEDARTSDTFGGAISFSGDLLAVGAYGADLGSVPDLGAVYLFNCSSFPCVQVEKLIVSDGLREDRFGISLSISGRKVVAGGSDKVNAAYLFDCSSFPCVQEEKLIANDTAADDAFGSSVAISGDLVVIGAYLHDQKSTNQGSAYIFDCSSSPCIQKAKLVASDGKEGDWFGNAAAISGDLVVIGAYAADLSRGAAYLFNCSAFPCVQLAKLTANDSRQGDLFGNSVSIFGSTVVVGALGDDEIQGSAYIFNCSSSSSSFFCNQVEKLTAKDGEPGARFGFSTAISPSLVVVGSYSKDLSFFDQGSAYIFSEKQVQEAPETKKKTKIIVGAVLGSLVLVALVAASIFLWKAKKGKLANNAGTFEGEETPLNRAGK